MGAARGLHELSWRHTRGPRRWVRRRSGGAGAALGTSSSLYSQLHFRENRPHESKRAKEIRVKSEQPAR